MSTFFVWLASGNGGATILLTKKRPRAAPFAEYNRISVSPLNITLLKPKKKRPSSKITRKIYRNSIAATSKEEKAIVLLASPVSKNTNMRTVLCKTEMKILGDGQLMI